MDELTNKPAGQEPQGLPEEGLEESTALEETG